MRDIRFIAGHRGGKLSKENHHKLIHWAVKCSEHALPLIDNNNDIRLLHALHVGKEWGKGNIKTGEAMKASLSAHSVAREASDPASIAIARSVGHAVATAHMADHSTGAALYALKAFKLSGKSVEEERDWQIQQLKQLPSDIVDLVVTTMMMKSKGFKI
jgi:hypothetical protein